MESKKPTRVSEMTVFQVYPGIEFIYNNFEVPNFDFDSRSTDNIMEISHCRKGRVECELKDGTYLYLGEGDLGINMLNNHATAMAFPITHYEGISVNLHLDILQHELPEILADASLDICVLKEKLCKDNGCFIMRATSQIEHIFFELYKIPDEIKGAYLKVKVIELLLFMSVLDQSQKEAKESYFKCHIETVKKIRVHIVKNYATRFTIDELAKQYCISPTTLKVYFKEVFGTTIASYMKSYRMKKSAEHLRKTHDSISDIAYSVGYESQSKFAIAFKELYGMSPVEYRKKCSFHEV